MGGVAVEVLEEVVVVTLTTDPVVIPALLTEIMALRRVQTTIPNHMALLLPTVGLLRLQRLQPRHQVIYL